jgi:Na+/H+-dicarboxylate symporter
MGKVLAILGGLIAMAGGVYLVILVWPQKFIDLVFGCIPPILFFGGLIALIAGISGIKDAARTKKLEEETKEEVKEEVKEEAAAEEEKKEEETKE